MPYETETWNMAQQTLQRLSKILDVYLGFSWDEHYGGQYKCLLELRKNLAGFLTDNEIKEINLMFEKLPKGWWIKEKKSVNPMHQMKVEEIFNEIYMYYIKKMKKRNLLMPATDDPGRAVSRMS